MSLTPAQREELVAATRMTARGLVDEVDPYLLAARVCVAHRCIHVVYGWDREARGDAGEEMFRAAVEAERLDAAEGFRLADWPVEAA